MKESVKTRRFKIFKAPYTDPLHTVGRTVHVSELSGKKSGNHTRQCLAWSALSNPAQSPKHSTACYGPFPGRAAPLVSQVALPPMSSWPHHQSSLDLHATQARPSGVFPGTDIRILGEVPFLLGLQCNSPPTWKESSCRENGQVKQTKREKDSAWPISPESPDPVWSKSSWNLIICANLVLVSSVTLRWTSITCNQKVFKCMLQCEV